MIRNRINDELKKAMKSKDMKKVSQLRFITSMLKENDINLRGDNTIDTSSDEIVIKTLQKAAKRQLESIEGYIKGSNKAMQEKEESLLKVIKEYLPEELSLEKTKEICKQAIDNIKATSMKEMGKVMQELNKIAPSNLNKAEASKAIRELLS